MLLHPRLRRVLGQTVRFLAQRLQQDLQPVGQQGQSIHVREVRRDDSRLSVFDRWIPEKEKRPGALQVQNRQLRAKARRAVQVDRLGGFVCQIGRVS